MGLGSSFAGAILLCIVLPPVPLFVQSRRLVVSSLAFARAFAPAVVCFAAASVVFVPCLPLARPPHLLIPASRPALLGFALATWWPHPKVDKYRMESLLRIALARAWPMSYHPTRRMDGVCGMLHPSSMR